MLRLTARAFADTLRQASGPSGILWLVAPTVAAYFLLGPLFGTEAMSGAWPGVVASFAALGVVAFAMFLWNLAAAPLRLEREKVGELETAVTQLRSEVKELNGRLLDRPDFEGEFRQIQWGGEFRPIYENGDIGDTETNERVLVVMVSVANVGTRPSAVRGWEMFVTFPNDGERQIPLNHLRHFSINHNGLVQTFTEANAIYTRTARALDPGDIVEGWLLAFAPQDMAARIVPGTVFRLRASDVFGRPFTFSYTLIGRPGQPIYFPAMEPTDERH